MPILAPHRAPSASQTALTSWLSRAAVVMLAGCPQPTRWYNETREACGLEEGQDTPLPWDAEGKTVVIPDDCARRLGAKVGLSWRDWDMSPRDIVGDGFEDTPSMVVSGLHVILATDLGSIGDGLSDPLAPSPLVASLTDLAEAEDLTDADPMAALWLEYLEAHVDRTYNDRSDVSAESSPASFVLGEIGITSLIGTDSFANPEVVASILVHEASHDELPAHIACDDPYGNRWCDADLNGAIGAGLWFSSQWLTSSYPDVPSTDCFAAVDDVERMCTYIEDSNACATYSATYWLCLEGVEANPTWVIDDLSISLDEEHHVVVKGTVSLTAAPSSDACSFVLYLFKDAYMNVVERDSGAFGSDLQSVGASEAFEITSDATVTPGEDGYSQLCVRLLAGGSNIASGESLGCIEGQ